MSKIKSIIVFEGTHQIGKTTLLEELHNPENGILHLYNSNIWSELSHVNPNIIDSSLYNNQFVSSLKSQIYFIETLLNTPSYHTILIDRWYLTSLVNSLQTNSHIKDFGDVSQAFNYVDGMEYYLSKRFNLHTIVFSVKDFVREGNKTTDVFDYTMLEAFKKVLEIQSNKHEILLEYVDGVTNIKEKFINFAKNNNICIQ